MDLKFIWIKEHRAIKDLNFNFCHDGEHQFHYDGRKIQVFKKQEYPIDFGHHISNITAIAGQNGSGKSSFCEVVLASTATLQNGSFGYNYYFNGIVCYGDHFFIQKDIEFTNEEEISNLGYRIIRFKDSPFEEMLIEWRSSFIKGGFIYYSNFLDRKSVQDENNLSNISTQNLLLEDIYTSTFHSYRLKGGKDFKDLGDKFTQYEAFAIEEDYRYVKFITKFPHLVSFLGPHSMIALHSAYSGINRFIYSKHSDSSEISKFLYGLEGKILNEIYPSKYINVKDNQVVIYEEQYFKNLIGQLYKINLLSILSERDDFELNIDEVLKLIYQNEIPIKLLGKPVIKLFALHEKLITSGHLAGEFNPFSYFTKYERYNDWRFYVIQHIHLNINRDTIELIGEFINLEKTIIDSENYSIKRLTNFTLYPYLSSGEASYLSLFSRIYDIIQSNQYGFDDREKLILFIDEGDVGFHPEWSRNLLNDLLNFLNLDFHSYQFQIILTTHSPYILSDLPKENIRLFNREKDLPPKIVESKSNTFGANIYDLMHDSFFMSNGFIGSFAEAKIDEIFSELSNKIENKKHKLKIDKSYIKSIISIIGEPLIQRQLSLLYDRVFNEDLEVEIIDRQMEVLNKLKERKLREKK